MYPIFIFKKGWIIALGFLLLAQLGQGQDWKERFVVRGMATVWDVASVDIDNDGDKDVVVGTDAFLLYFENLDGLGNFAHQVVLSEEFTPFFFIEDLNEDGYLDFITRNGNYIENKGNNKFSLPEDLGVGRPKCFADFDNDGDLDLLGGLSLQYYENIGDGDFDFVQGITSFGQFDNALPGDFDSDGLIDFLLEDDDGSLTWYKNIGGDFEEQFEVLAFSGTKFRGTKYIDIDNDGDLDIIGFEQSTGQVLKYENEGFDSWSVAENIGFVETNFINSFSQITIADLDGDNDLDILFDVEDTGVSWFENENGTFANSFVLSNEDNDFAQSRLSVSDLNGNGLNDVISAHRFLNISDPKVGWYDNQGNTFSGRKPISFHFLDTPAPFFSSADFDNDGDEDIIIETTGIQYAKNRGNGDFETTKPLLSASTGGIFLILDKDGDGDQDFLGYNQDTIKWFLNDGQADFSNTIVVGQLEDVTKMKLDYGDIDNDGDIDVLAERYTFGGDNQLMWFENIDETTYAPQEIELGGERSLQMRLFDLDLDNDLDVVGYYQNSNTIYFRENIGNGEYDISETIVTLTGGVVNSFYLEDLDGDNLIDLLYSTSGEDATIAYLPNTGTSFGQPDIILTRSSTVLCFPADFDNDGDLDLLHTYSEENRLYIDKNNGFGNFSFFKLLIDNFFSYDLRSPYAADFNGNGLINPACFYDAEGIGGSIPFEEDEIDNLVWFQQPSAVSAEIEDENCNNNETIGNNGDDFIELALSVESFQIPNGGEGYTVSVNNGDISPTTGTYLNNQQFVITPANPLQSEIITVTITDDQNTDFSTEVDVNYSANCSDYASLINPLITNITCNYNGTYPDDSDDFIEFDLKVSSPQFEDDFTLLPNGFTLNISSGTYNELQTYQTSAGSAGEEDLFIEIMDNNDANLTYGFTIQNPGTCSDIEPTITASSWAVSCTNPNTDSPLDDRIGFILDVDAELLSEGYTVSVDNGELDVTSGTYGMEQQFYLQPGSAGAGDILVTVTDAVDAAFSFELIIEDPGECSPGTLSIGGFTDTVYCNNNGTTINPDDDYIVVEVFAFAEYLSETYSITIDAGTIEPNIGIFGETSIFNLDSGSAGSGNALITLTITDSENSDFTHNMTFWNPGTCSVVATNDLNLETIQVAVSPNPFNEQTTFAATQLSNPEEYVIRLFDIGGRLQEVIALDNVGKAIFRNDENLKGTLIFQLQHQETKKVVTYGKLIAF